jgi:hypothetical protein
MVAELADVVREAIELRPVEADDVVVDIGANDGTLLAEFEAQSLSCPERVAVEPATNLQNVLFEHADVLIHDYFPTDRLTQYQGKAQIVTAIAMSYDLEDPVAFFRAIHDLLAPKGIAIIQFQDFGEQLRTAAFDNICHEHLEYYTLWSLSHMLRQAGLTFRRVQRRKINGGSLRVVLHRAEDKIFPEPSVALQLSLEAAQGLATPNIREGDHMAFRTFAWRCAQVTRQIQAVIKAGSGTPLTIDVYGASTKGNILLQILGIGPEQVRVAIDRSPAKWGHYTVTGIPIVSEEAARDLGRADVWLCPIWQFRDFVVEREAAFLADGGKMIFPLPTPEVVSQTWTPVPKGV